MPFEEFYSLTPRSFFNAVNGNRKKEDAYSKERWIMTRKIMYAAMMPYLKNNEEEHDILPFQWEKKQIEKIKAARILSAADDLKRMNEYWERQDAHLKLKDE
jgi:hypothetical protein